MTETKTHWRKQAALDEAQRWHELNQDWSKGLPAEVRGVRVKGNVPVVRVTQAQNGHEGAGMPWWRTDGKGGSDNAQGLSPWAPGWESWSGWNKHADDWGKEERRGPKQLAGPNGESPVTTKLNQQLSHTQLAIRKAWEAAQPVATLERVKPLRSVKWVTDHRWNREQNRRLLKVNGDWTGELNPENTGNRLRDVTWTVDQKKANLVVGYCKTHKNTGDLERLTKLQLSLAGPQNWVTALNDKVNGKATSLSWSNTDDETTPAPQGENTELAEWVRQRLTGEQLNALRKAALNRTQSQTLLARVTRKQRLATAELAEWAEARLTAKQLNALTTDDLSDPATRKARQHAKAKLQALPNHLRLRR